MIVDEIVRNKREELSRLKEDFAFDSLFGELEKRTSTLPPARDFAGAITGSKREVRIIAEVKKASPSKGLIREPFDPLEIARCYEKNGARAISVLTEERYFKGSLDCLTLVKNNTSVPVLRKDFIIDEYQVYEARAAGADAILLIASILEKGALKDLLRSSVSLGLHPLVEVHTESELSAALEVGAKIIGVNNRDLRDFSVDLSTTLRLAAKVPEDVILVSESGIKTAEEIKLLRTSGVDAFLIGESLMREKDPGKKLRELIGGNFL